MFFNHKGQYLHSLRSVTCASWAPFYPLLNSEVVYYSFHQWIVLYEWKDRWLNESSSFINLFSLIKANIQLLWMEVDRKAQSALLTSVNDRSSGCINLQQHWKITAGAVCEVWAEDQRFKQRHQPPVLRDTSHHSKGFCISRFWVWWGLVQSLARDLPLSHNLSGKSTPYPQ